MLEDVSSVSEGVASGGENTGAHAGRKQKTHRRVGSDDKKAKLAESSSMAITTIRGQTKASSPSCIDLGPLDPMMVGSLLRARMPTSYEREGTPTRKHRERTPPPPTIAAD